MILKDKIVHNLFYQIFHQILVSEHSSNHGNFLELLQFLANHNEDVKAVTLKNASENHKLTSPDIQKDIVNACATETIRAIIKDIGTSLFSILIDESRDVSTKEQMAMFSSILDVLEVIADDGVSSQQRCEAKNLLDSMQSFDFVFNLHLMKDILGITNELSQALQRKDHDIVNAMKLVGVCKQRLEIMRKSGWDSLLSEVSEFCLKHNIDMPNMDDMFLSRRRGQRKAQAVTNMHHYCVGIFYVVLDWQLQELNNRFNETNTELLLCLACLCPADSFSAFDSQKLLRLAQFYPKDSL